MIPDLPADAGSLNGGREGPARDGLVGEAAVPGRGQRRICSEPGCGRDHSAHGLCAAHYARDCTNSQKTGPIAEAVVHAGDDIYMQCPDGLVPLAAQAAENDARAIFTLLWRAIGNWHLQGILEEAAS